MGGDRFSTHHSYSSIEEEESSSNDQDFSSDSSREGILRHKVVENGAGNVVFYEFEDMGCCISSTSLASEVNCRRKHSLYAEVLATYDELQPRSGSLKEAKNKILSYTPGSWIDKVGGFGIGDYHVPQTTTLLLIGPKGSGKSSLVNKISRLFELDKFAPERAQVSNGVSVGQGTFFLQEYMIPRGSDSFCLYDTRALSDDSIENMKMLKQWLTRGVRHGELAQRASDDANLKSLLKFMVPKSGRFSGGVRAVNFVIMVVNGISVLESMDSNDEGKKQYTEMIAAIFSCPFLSFKDDKPVIVVTHGDLLTLTECTRLRIYLGNLLGVPPKTQIFDIPDGNNKVTELAIVDLLSHCLDRADRNLPPKADKNCPLKADKNCPSKTDRNCPPKGHFISMVNMLLLLACILLMGIGYISSMPGRFVQYKSPDHAPSGWSKSPDRVSSSVNKPSDQPAPSGVNKPASHLGMHTPPDPSPSGVNTPYHSGINKPSDPAPSGENTPPGPAPSDVNKPAAPSGVNKPAPPSGVNTPLSPPPSGINKPAPSCVNRPAEPDTSNAHISWHEIRHLWLDEA